MALETKDKEVVERARKKHLLVPPPPPPPPLSSPSGLLSLSPLCDVAWGEPHLGGGKGRERLRKQSLGMERGRERERKRIFPWDREREEEMDSEE